MELHAKCGHLVKANHKNSFMGIISTKAINLPWVSVITGDKPLSKARENKTELRSNVGVVHCASWALCMHIKCR